MIGSPEVKKEPESLQDYAEFGDLQSPTPIQHTLRNIESIKPRSA